MRMSTLGRRVQCPASEKMESKFPDTTNPAAERGTKLHAICEEGIKEKKFDLKGLPKDDAEAVLWAVSKVEEIIGDNAVETEIEVVACGIPGHVDVVALDKDHAYVLDYKFGFSPVNTHNNWQLKAYALGVANKFSVNRVTVGIIQPALEYAETVSYNSDELDVIEDELASLV